MKSRNVLILNGPNLNLLGEREPQIYGTDTLASIEARCRQRARELELTIDFQQSNHEGRLIDCVHVARQEAAAIIINPAGLSFTSVSLLDALKAFDGLKIEVHLTNPHQRESYYHRSLVSYTATAVIAGLGPDGYIAALDALASRLPAVR